jgi:hypothetical protein
VIDTDKQIRVFHVFSVPHSTAPHQTSPRERIQFRLLFPTRWIRNTATQAFSGMMIKER